MNNRRKKRVREIKMQNAIKRRKNIRKRNIRKRNYISNNQNKGYLGDNILDVFSEKYNK